MKKIVRYLVSCSAFVLLQCPVLSAEYGFPTTLRLGAGLSAADPLESFPYCFDYKTRLVSGSASGGSFRATVVRDRKQFLREMNVSASASGTYAFFSGSASGSVDERYSFDSDTLIWMVQFQSDLGRMEIYDETLKPFARDLINSKKHAEFARQCGTELVTQEHRRISVAAVYSMRNLTVEQKSAVEAKLDAGATASAWSAKATASYRNFIDEASRASKINVEIVTVGGPGPADLAPLFTDMGDLEQVSSILRSYAAKISFENAKATGYSTTKMIRYGWNGDSKDIGITELAIGDYYLIFRDTETTKQRAYGILQQQAAGVISLTSSQSANVQSAYVQSDKLLRDIVATARACRQEEKKCIPASKYALIRAKWPKLEPVGSVTQELKEVKCAVNPVPTQPQVPFECQQVASFLVFAQWSDIAGIEVIDKFGQRITPLHDNTISLTAAYDRAKAKLGPDLTEAKFLTMETGEEGFANLQDAISKGWAARELTLRFLFGAHTLNTPGLRTTLDFLFTSKKGLVSQRQAFMY